MQVFQVVPNTPREARVWNFLNSGEDFFPIREWPNYLKEMALKEHKNHRERYRLFLFLSANGLHPDIAASWVLMADYMGKQILHGDYDRAALAQISDMTKKAFSRELFQNIIVYDMIKERVRDTRM